MIYLNLSIFEFIVIVTIKLVLRHSMRSLNHVDTNWYLRASRRWGVGRSEVAFGNHKGPHPWLNSLPAAQWGYYAPTGNRRSRSSSRKIFSLR
jgi:hypothetical protein